MASERLFVSALAAMERDPRQFPYGYLTGGSRVLDEVRVFLWFGTLDEMLETLLDVEPRMYGVEPGRGLEAYQERVRPLLERSRSEGLTPDLLAEFAPQRDGGFVVDWWGTYPELRDGRGVFGCQVLDEFLGEERRGQRLAAADEDRFVEFLGIAG